MTSLVKLKLFCKVFGKMVVVVAYMSHVGKKPREATIFDFTSVVKIAKYLLHDVSLKPFFRWQGSREALGKVTPKRPLRLRLGLRFVRSDFGAALRCGQPT
jgi:hypothetical protein